MNFIRDKKTERLESTIVCNKDQTAELLDFHKLIAGIRDAAIEMSKGDIISPERMVVPIRDGGVMLSMPATSYDIAIHKLVNVQPGNAKYELPSIHGVVTVCDASTGKILCVLDGPEVTGRRTAAVSLLGIQTFCLKKPEKIHLIGTGVQAQYHVKGINAVFPQAKIYVSGSSSASSKAFCDKFNVFHPLLEPYEGIDADEIDVVLAVTTSTEPVFNLPALSTRLIIGVGAFRPDMAEIGSQTLTQSLIYADDPAGAEHEAGDLIRAGVDWSKVISLANAIQYGRVADKPIVFKSVGTAAWDLASARVALTVLYDHSNIS